MTSSIQCGKAKKTSKLPVGCHFTANTGFFFLPIAALGMPTCPCPFQSSCPYLASRDFFPRILSRSNSAGPVLKILELDDSWWFYVYICTYTIIHMYIYIAHKRNPFLWFRIYIYINNSLVLSSFLGHSKKIAQVNAFSCQKLERWASWGFKTLCLSGWWTGFPMMDYI